jgi:hypothetical protein
MHDIKIFKLEAAIHSNKELDSKLCTLKVWDISKTKKLSWDQLCHVLPVIHAITGCDTTSSLFGIGERLHDIKIFKLEAAIHSNKELDSKLCSNISLILIENFSSYFYQILISHYIFPITFFSTRPFPDTK